VTLPGGEANLHLVQLMLEAQNRQGKPLEWSYLLVLHQAATDGDVTTSEAAELLQADEPRARVVLNHLLELGFLESKGVKRNRSYHLSANVYGKLGRPAAYARQRGLDQAEREQKLLLYLRAKPTITRADVLELFPDLNPNQATYFLRQLALKGILESSGEKKQRIYRLR
jgi:ATP-dependent DNA helicase RecG